MIQVRHIRKAFKDLTVLDGIDLEIKSGEVTAIIGPSGSGKSTLLRCLNLLERPDDGIIEIGDAKLNAASYSRKDVHKLRQQTAMVFQNYNLFKNKTALQNVTEALITAQKKPRKEAEQIGMDLSAASRFRTQSGQLPDYDVRRTAAADRDCARLGR